MISANLPLLLARHAVAAFDRQLHLAELIRDADWHVDLTTGLLSFGDRPGWRIQILGTESEVGHTWLWAWANHASQILPELLQAAHALRELGEKQKISEFTEPMLSLDDIDGHSLSLVASEVYQANAYFRAPYEDGAAFLLIKDESFPRLQVPVLARITFVVPQALSVLPIVNHRVALLSYLESHGLAVKAEFNALVVFDNEDPVLTATFDEHNRLTRLDTTIKN